MTRIFTIIAALGAILFLGGQALAQQPQQPEWTKVDCGSADAHLLAPAGLNGNCFDGGFEKAQGQYDCRYVNSGVGSPQEGTEPHFWVRARIPAASAKLCATVAFPDPANAMQHFHRFVQNLATNWSAIVPVRDDLQVMFFDAKNQPHDGKCFAFTKYGPTQTRGKGYQFTMIGFFCRPPGQPLDAKVAAGIVDAVQLKM